MGSPLMHIRTPWAAIFVLLAALAFAQQPSSDKDSNTDSSQSDKSQAASQPVAAPTDEINRAAAESTWKAPAEVVVRNANIRTVTHGNIANGSILIRNGKFVEAGPNVNAGPNAKVIDAGG